MADPQSQLYLPIIALAEACWIVEHGRSRIPAVAHLLGHVDADASIIIVPLDRATLDLSLTLTSIGEMHDRQIVATTQQLGAAGGTVALLTRDQNIHQAKLVPVIW